MALVSFNAYRITQIDAEIANLKTKRDFLIDVTHLHEAHLIHLDQKIEWINQLLTDILDFNIWFSLKVTYALEKKFQLGIHHHENVVKSAQHHRLAPRVLHLDISDNIFNHTLKVAQKKNLVSFVNYLLGFFQIEVSYMYILAEKQFSHTLHITVVSNNNLLDHY